jgi:hypothetical protein
MRERKDEQTAYLPTVHGQPARFCNDYQLCVGGGRNWHVVPVRSLREVRRQIAASRINRARDGFTDEPNKYGYVLIRLAKGSR